MSYREVDTDRRRWIRFRLCELPRGRDVMQRFHCLALVGQRLGLNAPTGVGSVLAGAGAVAVWIV